MCQCPCTWFLSDYGYTRISHFVLTTSISSRVLDINDYGAVLLCELRFQQRKWTDGLSLWLRPHVKQFTSFGQGFPAVQRFFRLRASEAAAAAVARSASSDFGAEGHDAAAGGGPRALV